MADIKWNNPKHHSNILLSLYKLQQTNLFCDVEVLIDGGAISIHSLILCANMSGCTCLQDLNNFKESFSRKCSYFGIDIVQTLVKYLYTGEVTLKREQFKEFLKLCEMLEFKDVILALKSEISKCTSSDSVNKVIENNDLLNFPANSVLERFSNTAVPVTLVSNKNNVGKTLEDTLMEQNATFSMFSIEKKKEHVENDCSPISVSNNTNNQTVTLEQSENDSNSCTNLEVERNNLAKSVHTASTSTSTIVENSNVLDTVIKTEDVEMDSEEVTTSIQNAVARESHMIVTQENDSIGQRTCCKCNKILKIDEYVTHMKKEHTLHACPLCEWIGKRPHRLNEHMYCQHQVVNSPDKYPLEKCGEQINDSAMCEEEWGKGDLKVLTARSETEMKTMQKDRLVAIKQQEELTTTTTISTKKRPTEEKQIEQPKKKRATVISRSKSLHQPYLTTLESPVAPWDSPNSPNKETSNTIQAAPNTPADFYLGPDPSSTYTPLTMATSLYTDLLMNDNPHVPQTNTAIGPDHDFLNVPNLSQQRVADSTDRKLDAINWRLTSVERTQAEIKTLLQRILQLLQQNHGPLPAESNQPKPVVAEDLPNPCQQQFSDIPEAQRISLQKLEKMRDSSFSQGHFACKVAKFLFPELFTQDNIRLQYSFNGGGKLNKKELDKQKKSFLTRYILYFYPDCKEKNKFKALIVSSINEMLRRPVRLQQRQLNI